MRASNSGAKSTYPRYARRALETFSQFAPSSLSPKALISQASARSMQHRQLGEDLSESSAVSNPLIDIFGLLPDHYNSTPLLKRAPPNAEPSSAVTLPEASSSAKPALIPSAKPAVPATTSRAHAQLPSSKHTQTNHHSHEASSKANKKHSTAHAQKHPATASKKHVSIPAKKPSAHQGQKSPSHQVQKPSTSHPVVPAASLHHTEPKAPQAAATSPIHQKEPVTTHAVVVANKAIDSSQEVPPAHDIGHTNLPTLPAVLKVNTDVESSSASDKTSTATNAPVAAPVATQTSSPTPSSFPAVQNTTSPQSSLNGLNTNTISSTTLTSNAQQVASNNSASSHRLGQALVGVFGSLVLLTAALVAGIYFSRRHQNKKTTDRVNAPTDRSSSASFGGEKSLPLPRLSLTPTRELDFGVAPAMEMSPSDPVTRYSQGGVTLLRRLECLTARLDRSPTAASFASDDDSPMAQTPATEHYEPNTPAHFEHSNFAKTPAGLTSPLSGLVESTLPHLDRPSSTELPHPSQYANISAFWEDSRRSLLRSNSDDGSLNSPFRDELTSESHDLENPSTESDHHQEQHNNIPRSGSLTPPNKHDFHVHEGNHHFIIGAST